MLYKTHILENKHNILEIPVSVYSVQVLRFTDFRYMYFRVEVGVLRVLDTCLEYVGAIRFPTLIT